VKKVVGVWAPLQGMNPVCLSNILANTVNSKPARANVFHGLLQKLKVGLCPLLFGPFFGGMLHAWVPMPKDSWIDPQSQSQKNIREMKIICKCSLTHFSRINASLLWPLSMKTRSKTYPLTVGTGRMSWQSE
jgi:hypothetical protein